MMNRNHIVLFILYATVYVLFTYRYDRALIAFDTGKLSLYDYKGLLNDSSNITINYECQLPPIDPWDSNIYKYLNRLSNPLKDCVPKRTVLTSLVNGTLFISNRSLLTLGITYARCLYPIDDYNLRYGHWNILDETNVDNESNVDNNSTYRPHCDIVEVQTIEDDAEIKYQHLHTQIYIENEDENSNDFVKSISRESSSIYQPSVFILILDSTSSSEGMRSLSETMQLLTVDYEAVHFRYLNKVGLNSLPNAHALLFGMINYSSLIRYN